MRHGAYREFNLIPLALAAMECGLIATLIASRFKWERHESATHHPRVVIREAGKSGDSAAKWSLIFTIRLTAGQYWFVVGGLGSDGEIVRDEIAYMRHGPRDCGRLSSLGVTGELAKIKNEEELRRVLSE